MSKTVIVFGSDIVPLSREMPATGAGLRTWQFYNGLKSAGFDVHLSLYEGVCEKYAHLLPREVTELAWTVTEESQLGILDRVRPDAIVVCHWPTWHVRGNCPVPMVLDFHGPHLLERYYQKFGRMQENIEDKLRVFRQASMFTCAGDYQRDYFAGWLLQAGILPTRESLVSIPISQSPVLPPRKQGPRDRVRFVYSGVFLPWQDPFDALETACRILGERTNGQLDFFGGPHPVHKIDTARFSRFESQVQGTPAVHFHGFVNRSRLLSAYEQADVALDLMKHNEERELAFTTRTAEYLWCGLPVIYNDYSELSDYIRDYQAGWCVDPEDPAALERVLNGILDNPSQLDRYAANAQRLVLECFNWDRTIAPIANFCRQPHRPQRLWPDRGWATDFENARATLPLAEILPTQALVQEFTARHPRLCAVSVKLATYARSMAHPLRLELVEPNSEQVLAQAEVPATRQIDNEWIDLEFAPLAHSAGQRLALRISSPTGQSGQVPTVWATQPQRYPFGRLWQGGIEQPATLTLLGRYQAA